MNENNQQPIVGKNLLRMVMLQLYNNPRCIYREYIQNGLDAINDAVSKGILKNNRDGFVAITINNGNIIIEDNGTGIKSSEAAKILMDIANSLKNGIDTAGQFGVGRLSGGEFCEELEFITSYKGEPTSTTVSMNINRLRDILDQDGIDTSAEQVMAAICDVTSGEENEDRHYFKVILHNVNNSKDILLNESDILSYIRQTAPIDYSTTFNTLINSCPQKDFVERHKQIEKIKVSLNNNVDIEKGYGLKIAGNGDDIRQLRYFELPEHPKFGKLAWGWYAVTPFSVQIGDNDENVGIRLRKHNISLDKNILDPLFKETRGNKYFYGEIFITNENIRPDSGRHGLAAGEEADALKEQLKTYFKDVLHQLYTKASKYKGLLKDISFFVKRIDEAGNAEAKSLYIDRLRQAVDKFQNSTKPSGIDELNDVIAIYRDKYDTKFKTRVDELISCYSKPESPAGARQEPHTSSDSDSDDTTDGEQSVQTAGEPDITSATGGSVGNYNTASKPSVSAISTDGGDSGSDKTAEGKKPPVEVPHPQKPQKTEDTFTPLTEQGLYTEKEVGLLRSVYKMIGLICTPSDKKKLDYYMEWAIDKIARGNII